MPRVISNTTSDTQVVISKGIYAQALLFACYNGGKPSIFAFDRGNAYTVYEGTVLASSVSVSSGSIVVQKLSSQILYYNTIIFS